MLSPFLWTACVTPFSYKGDSIDYNGLQRLLTIQAEAGNGVVLLGSTGENLSLTDHERRTLVDFVCKLKLRSIKIIVGVPGVNLYQALEWLDFCQGMPICGYLMTTPIYTKPGIMGQTLWFEKLLEKAHVPVMLYNIPSRAGVNLYVETVCNLSSHERFWAIKDSSGNIDTLVNYKKVAPDIKVFCGDDNMILDMAACGAVGLVSVASNLWPYTVHKYVKRCLLSFQHYVLGSWKKTTTQVVENRVKKNSLDIWQQACKALYIASNPIPTKVLLHDIGLIEHETVRLPLSIEDLPSIEILRQVNKMILKWEEGLTNN
ncbi:MAG: 4-hydroxy-tetrahydrodipicolinate synthase [Wolbachia pipientis]|nr:4-hydroxy-tetrahydrodipicolinate synthase [Wolbachia pipientis]